MHDPAAHLLASALDHGLDGSDPAALAEAARALQARIAPCGGLPGVRIAPSPYVTYLAATGPQRNDPPLAASA